MSGCQDRPLPPGVGRPTPPPAPPPKAQRIPDDAPAFKCATPPATLDLHAKVTWSEPVPCDPNLLHLRSVDAVLGFGAPLSWRCEACGRVRDDAQIGVLTRDVAAAFGLPAGTAFRNVRHCNDNAACLDRATAILAEFERRIRPATDDTDGH